MEMKQEYKKSADHRWMVLEFDEIYEEDYQLRMLKENVVTGLLPVRGQGKDDKSIYRYDITGKISMKKRSEREKWTFESLKEFLKQMIQVLNEVDNFLLDRDCISLDPNHIFYKNGTFYFCYCPGFKGGLRQEFHVLTEFFVKETDYEDRDAVYLASSLHKASMEEQYSVEEIYEKILQEKETEEEKKEVMPQLDIGEEYELEEDRLLNEWSAEKENIGHVVRERKSVWQFVTQKIRGK